MFGGRQGIPVDGVKRKKWKLQAMISGPDGGDILRGAVLQRNSAISPRNPRDAAASGRRAQADRLAAASHGLRMDGADLASCLAGTGGCARGAAGPDFHRYEVMLLRGNAADHYAAPANEQDETAGEATTLWRTVRNMKAANLEDDA
jgi:hypothetical protein